MKNNKNILIGLVALVVVLIVGGVYLVTKKSATLPVAVRDEMAIATIKPEEIGLTLTMGADGKRVVMKITKTDGISSLDYELSYTSVGDIPRGAIGHVAIKTAGQVVSQEIVLGTCSDTCHYDKDVRDIKLIVKVTKTDGSVSQVEQKLK